jgi:predicted nucleic acid-binding protein
MALHILLDSYPLGLLSKPAQSAEVLEIGNWGRALLAAGHHIYIPEVIDYELRRELLRANKLNSIAELDRLKLVLRYLPITTRAMLRAAELWATSRQAGNPTGDPAKLDIDVILSAQALTLPVSSGSIIVATSNVNHISRFVHADLWSNISPKD